MASKKGSVKKRKEQILKEARRTIKTAGNKDTKGKVQKREEKILKWADKTIKGSKLAKSVKKRKK